MIGRGLATVGIWASPAPCAWAVGHATVSEMTVMGYIAGMMVATLIVWAETLT